MVYLYVDLRGRDRRVLPQLKITEKNSLRNTHTSVSSLGMATHSHNVA